MLILKNHRSFPYGKEQALPPRYLPHMRFIKTVAKPSPRHTETEAEHRDQISVVLFTLKPMTLLNLTSTEEVETNYSLN
jgi:hypothetical protein